MSQGKGACDVAIFLSAGQDGHAPRALPGHSLQQDVSRPWLWPLIQLTNRKAGDAYPRERNLHGSDDAADCASKSLEFADMQPHSWAALTMFATLSATGAGQARLTRSRAATQGGKAVPSPVMDEMAALEVMELTPAPVPSGFAFLGDALMPPLSATFDAQLICAE